MKGVVVVLFVFFAMMHFVGASCVNYFDDGNDPDAFGYVVLDDVFYPDICSSSIQLKEYSCSGSSLVNTSYSCSVCSDGICYPSSCSSSNSCNPSLRKWCDGSSWLDSGYCSDSNLKCYLVDSTCASSTCTEGACDYENHKYCSANVWVSEDYCDGSHCGNDLQSLGYCFCADTSLSVEENCVDDSDDDCDGNVDCQDSDCEGQEGCVCDEGETQSCSTDVGSCESGVQECVGGSWDVCSGVEADEELCDELDNDCDGDVDEDCTCLPGDTRDCGVNVGICKAGVQVCEEDATWSLCFGASYAASEIEECNGLDDDCDGKVDEGCGCVANMTQSCGSDIGGCVVGAQTCVNGTWGDCSGSIEPFPEICGDLIDNDCDDELDNDDATCEEPVFNFTEEIVLDEEEEETFFPVCEADADCSQGFVCVRALCVEETLGGDVEETVEEDVVSSVFSQDEDFEEEDTVFLFSVLAGVGFLFVVGIFFVWYSKRKKRTPELLPAKKMFSQVSFPSSLPSGKAKKKNVLEKDIEKSFEESRRLFRK